MNRFIVDGQYGALLAANGIDVRQALLRADLPGDLFDTDQLTIPEQDYYRFFETLKGDTKLAERLACASGIERFSPPIYGAYCSANGREFLDRLAMCKQLMGPLVFRLSADSEGTTLAILANQSDLQVPAFVVLSEFMFLVHVMRLATSTSVTPLAVRMRSTVPGEASSFFGVPVEFNGTDEIRFSAPDLSISFRSAHPSMWDYLKPELSRRLAALGSNTTVREQVASVLPGLLLAGTCDERSVAEELGISRRTLQRHLRKEGTTFQCELQATRRSLAERYLLDTELHNAEIAGMLGYQEVNSFLRAFMAWTGMSPARYRCQAIDAAQVATQHTMSKPGTDTGERPDPG